MPLYVCNIDYNFFYIQAVNNQAYSNKEIILVYIYHLDAPDYNTIKLAIKHSLKTLLGIIPVKYRVPGITTAIHQLTKRATYTSNYVSINQSQYPEDEIDEENNEHTDNYDKFNYSGNYQHIFNRNKQ